jgi:hypothetical protein
MNIAVHVAVVVVVVVTILAIAGYLIDRGAEPNGPSKDH